ncbi:hypothetical protein MMIC_P2098 [Mariprofundus micogutta]|uniref:Cytochrome c domain-containing protein n=1 Tax=Mariprofundus micogutta TaxID=1921010 RepID=A0A1L8CQC5_9PROT|nr:c-type cytochrome [Mariprofundus micogutta]GAV21118.1 hypothetical protein MMIC_P2098 [Mariprofundus micogutta]
MKNTIAIILAAAFLGLTSQSAIASDGVDVEKVYSKKCKMCHSFDKKKTGPAFKDMNKDPEVLKTAFTTDRVKMMKGVNKKLNLNTDQAMVDALVAFIQSKQ